MSRLTKRDIVGNEIVAIQQSPIVVDEDGFGGCTGYVTLGNGLSLMLECGGSDHLLPPRAVDLTAAEVEPCDDELVAACIGDKVTDVAVSEFWPSIGLVLESGRLLFLSAVPNPNRSGALIVVPSAEPIGRMFHRADFRSWE